MCGILIFDSKKINSSLKKNSIKSLRFLKHRGPDKTFFKKNKSSLIGFNRLSINNISNGHQPYESECGNYSVVFNGEIFNYKELEIYLNKKGINTNNASEAEIIISFYKLYGESCLKFFRGFFCDRYLQ